LMGGMRALRQIDGKARGRRGSAVMAGVENELAGQVAQ